MADSILFKNWSSNLGYHKLDQTKWIEGGGPLPRPKYPQDPYRSELGGLLGITVCLSCLSRHRRRKHLLTTACDGLSALQKVHARKESVKPTWTFYDLLTPLIDVWKSCHSKPKFNISMAIKTILVDLSHYSNH